MALQDTRDKIDAAVDQVWPQVEAWQADYQTANGRAWQGRRTHSVLPVDAVATRPDVGTSAPPDSTPWPVNYRAGSYPMALEVHAYRGPQGHGWVVHISATAEGQTWQRTVQSGPESWRQQGWYLVRPGQGVGP